MADMSKIQLVPDETMQSLLSVLGSDGSPMEPQLLVLLEQYPDDPRLPFLQGSLFAGDKAYDRAEVAMARAVALAPDFHIARFQLGFLFLTSGKATEAMEVWGPLLLLPEDFYLRQFVQGLTHMIRDEFADALRWLKSGLEANAENLPLNNDMQMIIDRINEGQANASQESSEVSAVDMLLRQSSYRGDGQPN